MKRVVLGSILILSTGRGALLAPLRPCSSKQSEDHDDGNERVSYSERVSGAHGKDNVPGVYKSRPEPSYVEKAFPNWQNELRSHNATSPHEPHDRADNIKDSEFDTSRGGFEETPHFAGGPGAMRYQNYVREPGDKETVLPGDMLPRMPIEGHHPNYDYVNHTGNHAADQQVMSNGIYDLHINAAKHSLYRACLKSLPLVKHTYFITASLVDMRKRVRHRFMVNQHVQDPDALRHLLFCGWVEYHDTILDRRTHAAIENFFTNYNIQAMEEKYTYEEGQQRHDRSYWNGEEQRREGPFDGHWSWVGQETAEEVRRLAGRIPVSWSSSKGYFEKLVPDGTNYWEKNMDYEGWYIRNTDPDVRSAQLEAQAWIDSAYNQPRHYASKNRRGYRRLVKDIEELMATPFEDLYTHNREQMFQFMLREDRPESNRVDAERRLAMQDDDFYSTRHEETEACVKQVMREMPNPMLWRSDAFYFRLRYLLAPLEYNWARVPIGATQEKLYNEWVSDTVNFAILNSDVFAALRRDKRRNAMAKTWADFYAEFDPDVPATRQLPWYHKEFNYDRRYKWDERCMRMKRWVQCGTIDGTHAFFDSAVAEWEQYVNRPERLRAPDNTDRRLTAPRMVQLYRSLNRLLDVALANQMRAALQTMHDMTSVDALAVADVQRRIDAHDWSNFVFRVPVIIYPDGQPQPAHLGLDGEPTHEALAAQ